MVKVLLVAGLLTLATIDVAPAWGPEGHVVIAMIAEDRLAPEVKEKARLFLSGAPLYTAALFADELRASQRKLNHEETSGWHFVDIPFEHTAYNEATDCKEDAIYGDCIIKAIERSKAKIRDADACSFDRVDALKFLVHFVGDVHQPFHTINRITDGKPDHGGNDVNVTFFGEPWTLHAVWDDGLILRSKRTAEDYAYYLEHRVLAGRLSSEITNGDPVAWANDAHKLAQAAYVDNNTVLAEDYFNRFIPVVDEQLALAGARLAAELTEVLKEPLPFSPIRGGHQPGC